MSDIQQATKDVNPACKYCLSIVDLIVKLVRLISDHLSIGDEGPAGVVALRSRTIAALTPSTRREKSSQLLVRVFD